MVAGFVVVVAVNAVMLTLALGTFNGLSTDGAYDRGLAYNQTLAAEAAQQARDLGMTGKGAIHPKQLQTITETFTPSAAEVAEAQRMVDAFEAQDRGLLVVNGRLVEKPVIVRMQRILAIAAR